MPSVRYLLIENTAFHTCMKLTDKTRDNWCVFEMNNDFSLVALCSHKGRVRITDVTGKTVIMDKPDVEKGFLTSAAFPPNITLDTFTHKSTEKQKTETIKKTVKEEEKKKGGEEKKTEETTKEKKEETKKEEKGNKNKKSEEKEQEKKPSTEKAAESTTIASPYLALTAVGGVRVIPIEQKQTHRNLRIIIILMIFLFIAFFRSRLTTA